MAANDENLTGLEDLFDADNSDDMAEFMSMLDSIDVDDSPLLQEMESVDTFQMDEEVSLSEEENFSTEEEDFEMDDMMLGLGLDDVEDMGDMEDLGETKDLPMGDASDDESILQLLDAVGEESAGIAEAMVSEPEPSVDESAEELEDILADFASGEPEPEQNQEPEVKEPKKGFFKKVNEKFHKQPTEEELFLKMQEEAEEKEWEEKQQEEARIKKEEKKAKKQQKKEAAAIKKQERDEKKAAKKAAAEEKKAAKKAEKESKKGPIPKSQLVPLKPMIAFVILGIAVSVLFLTFSNYSYYNSSIDEAKEKFIHQKYEEAYEILIGLDIKKKDEKFYEQVQTVRIVDRDLESYKNFVKVGDYELALEALVRGVGKYSVQAEYAKELKLEKEMYNLYEEMLKELTVRFGMTEKEALSLYNLKDKEGYTKQIEQVARDAAIRDGILEPIEVEKIAEAENVAK